MGYRAYRNRCVHLYRFHRRPLDRLKASATKDVGRNAAMVLVLHHSLGTAYVPQVALPMDTIVFDRDIAGIRHNQYPETGDTRPVADACLAELLVHPACHRVYLFLFRTRLCIHPRNGRMDPTYKQLLPHNRPSCLYRHGIPDVGNDERGNVGESSLGQLLELGPQRDMGSHYMVHLPALHSPAALRAR